MEELENFSYLLPGELAGMGYPEGPEALEALRALGFRSLVSLSRRAPDLEEVGPLLHLSCPMTDYARIPALDLHRAVAFLDRAPAPVAVHGEAGLGRTGVVLACRLVSLGQTADEAIAAVRRARPGSIDDPELAASVADYAAFLRSTPGRLRAPMNFAPASPFDRIVHGAERPGYTGGEPDGAALEAWLGLLSRQGIREVLCLMDQAILDTYPGLLDRYRREFLRVACVPIPDMTLPSPRQLEEALAVLRRAEEASAPIVVHCGAGIGRTGLVLAAWLCARHGLRPEQAVEVIRVHARSFGALREPLEAGSEGVALLRGLSAG